MVVNSIAAPPDPKRDAAAARLVADVPTWPLFTLRQPHGSFPAGTVFRRVPSERDPKVRYLANNLTCQCPDYQRAGMVCKHVRAILRYEESLTAPKPIRPAKPLKTYEDIFGICADTFCGEDRLIGERFCGRHLLVDAF